MSDFLRNPILSRIAFFGNNSSGRTSATVGALRRAAFAATNGTDPKDILSDEVSETDIQDRETRLERAHGDAIVNELLLEKGVDVRNDPLAALRILDGKKSNENLLRGSGRNVQSPYLEDGTNNPAYKRQADWLRGWDEMIVNPLIGHLLDTGLLQAQLTTYDDAALFAKTRQYLQGGFYLSSHLETALKVIGSAKTDLNVGFYQLEQGAIAQGILDAVSRNVRTNIRLSSPHSAQGLAISQLFGRTASAQDSSMNLSIGRASGVDSKTGSPINSLDDHFKFIAVNLDTVNRNKSRLDDENLMDRMVWISSANATLGAMGFGHKRPGQALRSGRNLEATFLLSYDLVKNGFFGDDETRAKEIFYSLTEQAKNASIWMMNESLDRGRDFSRGIAGLSTPVRSRILETQGLTDLYNSIISDLTLNASSGNIQGVKAYIANYGLGTDFVDSLFNLLAAGGEVNLLRHPRGEGLATEAIRTLRSRMNKAGIDQRLLVDTVAYGEEFVHAKASIFEFTDLEGNRRYHQIVGSQNLSNRHLRGYEAGRGGVTTRDLSIFLHGEDAVGNKESAALTVLQFRSSQLFRERSDRFRIMADGGWDRYQLYGLNADINIEKIWTAGASDIDTKMLNKGVSRALNAIRFKIGGPVSVGVGNDRVSIDLSDLVQLTVKDYGNMGPNGTLFIQELSKFVGPTYGIRKFEREEGVSKEPNNLEQLYGVKDYSAKETILAAVGAAQEEYKGYLQSLAAAIGGRRLQLELMDPVNKGKIRQAMKLFVRQAMEHFAGVEAGTSAYAAKQFTRLGFLQKRIERSGNNHWLLDINNVAKLDVYAVEKALTGRFDPDLMYRLDGKQMFFTAGSLSSFSASGNTPPRFYDMAAFRYLPMSAIVRRKNEEGEEIGENEFMFLLPQSKLMQLPQRLQNIMSARNLSIIDFDSELQKTLKSNVDELVGTSRLTGEKGEAVRGIKFKGFAVPGLGGDNAYVIGEAFENAYFGDENFRKQAKLPIGTTIEASLAMFADKLKDLVSDGIVDPISKERLRATQLADGRVYLSSELLRILDHKLPTGLIESGGYGANRVHYVNLNTDRVPDSGIIIDANDLVAERDQSRGLFILTIHGTTVRRLTSGDRSIIGGKFPYAFVQRGSRAVQTITQNASRGLFSGTNNDVNVIFGEKILKTGQAFIETGAELLATERSSHLLRMLRRADLSSLSSFAGLFEKFTPYMTSGERETIQPLLEQLELASTEARNGSASSVDLKDLKARLIAELEYSASVVKEGPLKLGVHHRAIAGSMLAFGLHALASYNENLGKEGILNEAFTSSDRSFPARGVDFSKLTVQQVLGATYMTMVSAPSAAAVAMSSRNTVNLLHYHSDFYTDSFMDLMATSPSMQRRMAAYRELVVGGLLGAKNKAEFVLTSSEFNPMTRYQPGFASQFQRVLEITRELQGYGTSGTLTPEEAADPVLRIKNLRAEYRQIRDSIHSVLMGKSSLIAQQGNVLEQTFTGSALREDYSGVMSRTFGSGTVGSVQANAVTEFLQIQQRAGVGARVLFVPQLGEMDAATGVFVQNPRGTRVRHVETRFNSPDALLSIGSYDDFAHQMQKLQFDIEKLLYTTSFIIDLNGHAVNLMDENVYKDYINLQEKLGELSVIQGMAAVSDMQKMFSGRVSVTGKNMIIGTLPEIPHGTMILGQEAWNFMKEGAAKEITEGLVELTSEQMKTLADSGNQTFSKALFGNVELLLNKLRSQGMYVPGIQELRLKANVGALAKVRPALAPQLDAIQNSILEKRAEIDSWHAEKQNSWNALQRAQDNITRQIKIREAAKESFLAMHDLHSSGVFGQIQKVKTKIEKTKAERDAIRNAFAEAKFNLNEKIHSLRKSKAVFESILADIETSLDKEISSLERTQSEFFDGPKGYNARKAFLKRRIAVLEAKRAKYYEIVSGLKDQKDDFLLKKDKVNETIDKLSLAKTQFDTAKTEAYSKLGMLRSTKRAFEKFFEEQTNILTGQEKQIQVRILSGNYTDPASLQKDWDLWRKTQSELNSLQATKRSILGGTRFNPKTGRFEEQKSALQLDIEKTQDRVNSLEELHRKLYEKSIGFEISPDLDRIATQTDSGSYVADSGRDFSRAKPRVLRFRLGGLGSIQDANISVEQKLKLREKYEGTETRKLRLAKEERGRISYEINLLRHAIQEVYDRTINPISKKINELKIQVEAEKLAMGRLYGLHLDANDPRVLTGEDSRMMGSQEAKLKGARLRKQAVRKATREITGRGSALDIQIQQLYTELNNLKYLESQIVGTTVTYDEDTVFGDKTYSVEVKQKITGAMGEELRRLYAQKDLLYQKLNELNARREALFGKYEQRPDGSWTQVTQGTYQAEINNLHKERARLAAQYAALYGSKLDPNDPRLLTGEMSSIPGSKDRELAILRSELDTLYSRRDALQVSDQSVTRVVELMMESLLQDNSHARNFLMSGLFQRSGAPPGPMGLVVGKILTIQEYNDMIKRKGGALMIHETLSARSVFLSSGSMAYNLGDFDGDTGSITWLQQFSRLKALDAIQKATPSGVDIISPGERLLLSRVENSLNMSPEEHQAHFARFYSGMTEIFDPNKIFFWDPGSRADLKNLSEKAQSFENLDQIKSYFYGLENKVRDYARSTSGLYDISTRKPVNLIPEEINLSSISANELGMTNDELKDLIAFRERKKVFFGLATTVNEYAAQIFEMQDTTYEYVSQNSYRFRAEGITNPEQAAFDEYTRTRGAQVAFSKMESAIKGMAGSGIAGGNQEKGDRRLSSESLMTYFLSTSYAATTLVSKVFEIGFSMSSVAEDTRATGFRTLRDRVEANASIRALTQNLSMTEFRAFIQEKSRIGNELGRSSEEYRLYHDFGNELNAIDRAHANLAGVVVTLNQIAREAIKPRGGDPLEEIFRFTDNMNAANPGERRNYVYGAQQLARELPRYRGIDAIMKIVHGRDLSGASVDITKWSIGEGGEWDVAHRSISSMLIDYYAGQVNAMYNMAATRQEQVEMLIRKDRGTGLALFTNAEEANAFLDDSVNPERIADQDSIKQSAVRMSNFTVSDSGDRKTISNYIDSSTGEIRNVNEAFESVVTAQAREIYRNRGLRVDDSTTIDATTLNQARKMTLEKAGIYRKMEDVTDQRAMDYIWWGMQASREKETRTEYMVSIESGDAVAFARASARLTGREKIKLLANSTSRGAFQSETGMRMVFEDVLSSFGTEQELRRAAQDTYTSDTYVNNLVDVYNQYRESGNVLGAFERMRQNYERTVEGTRATFTQALNTYNALIGAPTHDPNAGSPAEAYLNLLPEEEINKNAEMRSRALAADAVEARKAAEAAQVQYETALALQEQNQTWMNEFDVGQGVISNEGFIPTAARSARGAQIRNSFATATSSYDTLIRRGGLISSTSSNILIPLAMSKLSGITLGAAGGFAGASAGDSFMSQALHEAGEFTEMALRYASPLNAIRESVRNSAPGMEGLIHVGAVGLSMVAGAWAGERAGRNISQAYTAAGINKIGSGVAAMTMAASSIVGFGAGMAAMIAIEGLAAKFGFLKKENSVVYGDLIDSGTQFTIRDETLISEVDDLSAVEGENVVLQDANGETNITGSFYVYSLAARDDDSFDTASVMDADLGTYISGMSYDMSGGSVRDSAFNAELSQVTGTNA